MYFFSFAPSITVHRSLWLLFWISAVSLCFNRLLSGSIFHSYLILSLTLTDYQVPSAHIRIHYRVFILCTHLFNFRRLFHHVPIVVAFFTGRRSYRSIFTLSFFMEETMTKFCQRENKRVSIILLHRIFIGIRNTKLWWFRFPFVLLIGLELTHFCSFRLMIWLTSLHEFSVFHFIHFCPLFSPFFSADSECKLNSIKS